jgi:cephalosporin-C deacetylase-like acetyl esterase
MTSRRNFLQAGAVVLAGVGAAAPQGHSDSPGELTVAAPSFHREYWNDWPAYLTESIEKARERRLAILRKITSRGLAEERVSFVREQVWKLIGGQPERTPLNVQSAGTLNKTGYRIEKLIFESQPKLYVPAHLYLPANTTTPRSAILAPLGHALNGKGFRSYQTLFQNLARKGYVVMTFDPYGQGERLQYLDKVTGKRRFSSTGEHDQFGIQALLLGTTCTQFEVWDCVRALDYLVSRPEVDHARIGCAGHSGGGTLTMYLSALEPRIHVAIEVEGHTENVAGPKFDSPGAYADAEQNLVGGLPIGIDRGDLLCAFAPKPLLLCYSEQDAGTTYSGTYVEGTKEIFSDLKTAYGLWGAQQKVGLYASRLPHDYDYGIRRATYGWFNQWLNHGSGDSAETALEVIPDAELNCTPTGQILTSLGGRTPVDINTAKLRDFEARYAQHALLPRNVLKQLGVTLGLPERISVSSARRISTNDRGDLVAEEFEFQSEPLIRTPGWLLKQTGVSQKLPVVIYLSDSGKDVLLDGENEIPELTKRGFAVCSLDLRGSGATTPKFPVGGPQFFGPALDVAYGWTNLVLGKPILGQRVRDLLAGIQYLRTRPDLDGARIGIYGAGSAGIVALIAAAIDRMVSVLLERTLTDFASMVESTDYHLPLSYVTFGLLRDFDLPQVAAALSPCPLWLVNPVGANGEALNLEVIHTKTAPILAAYIRNPRDFQIVVSPDGGPNTVAAWLDTLQVRPSA